MGVLGSWVILVVLVVGVGGIRGCEREEQTRTFLSPAIYTRPGWVNNKYYEVGAPEGHFATVDFNAELVYENGEPVPLTDVYLHHWVMYEYTIPEDQAGDEDVVEGAMVRHGYVSGKRDHSKQAWAKGGETRHLNSSIPAPYAMISGGPGVRSKFVLNVHGIDTRGAHDRMRCTECLCELFTGGNRSDVSGDYVGGLRCCRDGSRCKLRDDFNGDDETLARTYHLKYTWTYIAVDECVVPLQDWMLDVTAVKDSRGVIEYNVEGNCKAEDVHKPECVHVKETVLEAEHGGDLVYAVSHLHAYSLDSSLWGEDGRLICQSPPIYGHGTAAGDEKGYVVGIRHCTPSLGANGAVGRVRKGEKLRFQVKYTKVDGPHTGVMGILFMKIAEQAEIEVPVALLSSGNRKILN